MIGFLFKGIIRLGVTAGLVVGVYYLAMQVAHDYALRAAVKNRIDAVSVEVRNALWQLRDDLQQKKDELNNQVDHLKRSTGL